MAGPDYIVELSGRRQEPASSSVTGRPWLAVRWRCCEVYSRMYRRADGTAYEGRCPRCGRPIRVRVGPGGTSTRFFEAW